MSRFKIAGLRLNDRMGVLTSANSQTVTAALQVPPERAGVRYFPQQKDVQRDGRRGMPGAPAGSESCKDRTPPPQPPDRRRMAIDSLGCEPIASPRAGAQLLHRPMVEPPSISSLVAVRIMEFRRRSCTPETAPAPLRR